MHKKLFAALLSLVTLATSPVGQAQDKFNLNTILFHTGLLANVGGCVLLGHSALLAHLTFNEIGMSRDNIIGAVACNSALDQEKFETGLQAYNRSLESQQAGIVTNLIGTGLMFLSIGSAKNSSSTSQE